MRAKLLIAVVALAAAAVAAGAAARPAARVAKPTCPAAWKADWQRLADRIDAPVYCPAWMPDPLDGDIDGPWNNIDSVDPDGSYLIGFVWQERGEEIHVNFRGYPGRTAVPTCRSIELVGGRKHEKTIPCFDDPRGTRTAPGIRATVFTVNQDADQWHVLYGWRHAGSFYSVSQHIAPPLGYTRVVKTLDRIFANLVLVKPR